MPKEKLKTNEANNQKQPKVFKIKFMYEEPAYHPVGAEFCCTSMQDSWSIDINTGPCVTGKFSWRPVWFFRGAPINFCPFCGAQIEVDVVKPKDTSQIEVPNVIMPDNITER